MISLSQYSLVQKMLNVKSYRSQENLPETTLENPLESQPSILTLQFGIKSISAAFKTEPFTPNFIEEKPYTIVDKSPRFHVLRLLDLNLSITQQFSQYTSPQKLKQFYLDIVPFSESFLVNFNKFTVISEVIKLKPSLLFKLAIDVS